VLIDGRRLNFEISIVLAGFAPLFFLGLLPPLLTHFDFSGVFGASMSA
jgi:hypothetical protein